MAKSARHGNGGGRKRQCADQNGRDGVYLKKTTGHLSMPCYLYHLKKQVSQINPLHSELSFLCAVAERVAYKAYERQTAVIVTYCLLPAPKHFA